MKTSFLVRSKSIITIFALLKIILNQISRLKHAPMKKVDTFSLKRTDLPTAAIESVFDTESSTAVEKPSIFDI